MAKKYKFAGKTGGFVPGLPEEIDESEAKDLGVEDTLRECIKAGLYKEVKSPAKKEK